MSPMVRFRRPGVFTPVAVLAVLPIVLLTAGACRSSSNQGAPARMPLKVAAAADLAFAFRELGARFEGRTGIPVIFSFGSTGLLARQIHEGAPFDVFAAASVSFVADAVRGGRCDGETQALYARGRIVLWWSDEATVAPPQALGDLVDRRFAKIAIANPEHAPYGRAAEEALRSAGVWEAVKPRLVFGENVQQTLEYARTGNADAALVALSLAIITPGGRSLPIEPSLHRPIDQALVVCAQGERALLGRRFTAFVNGEEGRAVMRRFGFLLPGETNVAAAATPVPAGARPD
jgi:molybdate transport system substrate-binding protein